MECCEKLIVSNSNKIDVKRNVWNLLSLDIQLDVFQCLRAYDLYRNGRFVSRQWYNVIEQHRGMLPKFRQLLDCREQNRLIDTNGEGPQRLYETWDAAERTNRIRRGLMWTYLLLGFLSFIAVLLAQPISAEQIAAKMLLIMITLRMLNSYDEIACDDYAFLICDRYYSLRTYSICLKPLKGVWPVYLGVRSLIFVGLGILVRLTSLPDTLFHTVLATLYLPEGTYLINWSINACCQYRFKYQQKEIVMKLRPELRGAFVYEYEIRNWRLINGHIPARVNIHACFDHNFCLVLHDRYPG